MNVVVFGIVPLAFGIVDLEFEIGWDPRGDDGWLSEEDFFFWYGGRKGEGRKE